MLAGVGRGAGDGAGGRTVEQSLEAVALGNGAPVPDAQREAFELERDRLKTLLDGPSAGAIASAATDTGERPLP